VVFPYESCEYADVIITLVFSLLGGTFENEQEIRSDVAITLEMFIP